MEYTATTWLFVTSSPSQISLGIQNCSDFFKKYPVNKLSTLSVHGEGETEIDLYAKTDNEAMRHIQANKELAEKDYDVFRRMIEVQDVGAGKCTGSFMYSFEREGRVLDSFELPFTYDGGSRFLCDTVEFILTDKSATANVHTNIPLDRKGLSLTYAEKFKLCLPGKMYASEETYGEMFKLDRIFVTEDGQYQLDMTLKATEDKMDAIKAQKGNWYALVASNVAVKENDKPIEIWAQIPIVVK